MVAENASNPLDLQSSLLPDVLKRTSANGLDVESYRSNRSVQPDFPWEAANPNFGIIGDPLPFTSGVFTVGSTGQVGIDYLFDGGGYQGELAIFSLDGLDALGLGTSEFIQEAVRRALSNSDLGHVVISDQTDGARFGGASSWEDDFNAGDYLGVRTFSMRPGSRFGVVLAPNGTIQQIFQTPNAEDELRPLFSMVSANPNRTFQFGQIADVDGSGRTFTMEDLRLDSESDRDYNDIIFHVIGAVGSAVSLDQVIDPGHDWRPTDLGQKIIAQVGFYVAPGKVLPGDAAHPAIPAPIIPLAMIDQGSNGWLSPTRLEASSTQDVIDQVSSTDLTDIYQVRSADLLHSEISVLSGNLSFSFLTTSGQVLGSKVLAPGTHSLQLPSNLPADVLVKIDNYSNSTATYILTGFESKAEEPFNISLEFAGGLTAAQQAMMQAAAKSVEAMIAQGVPSAIVDGKIIDDINFKISLNTLDGLGGTAARTKIDFMRYGSLLPAQALTQFDAADVAELERTGQLFSVVQHELLHGLGFGNLWEAKGLVDYAGTPLARYNGANAVQAFKELGGLTDDIALETMGDGSAGLHWNEVLFQDEVMTYDLGFKEGADGQVVSPISTVTLASLADLGYQVNLNRATPDFGLFGTQGFNANDLTPEQIEAFRILAATSFGAPDEEFIYATMPAVESDQVAPEIWAHAERFWQNGEYYDWVRYRIQAGDTLSQIALDTMGSAAYQYYKWIGDHNGIPNYNFIVAGNWIEIPRWHPNYEWEQEQERLRREEEFRRQQEDEARRRLEQEAQFSQDAERRRQDEENRRREAEAQQRQLEEQQRRLAAEQRRRREQEEFEKEQERLRELERQAEIARQQGKGGLDWYVATPLSFGNADPFEIKLGDVVGNLVPDDYYRFTLSRPGRLTAELKQLLADADLVLYDARNRPIAYSMREGITDEQIITDLIPGTYMLRVNNPKGVTTDYELMVRFQHILSATQKGPPPGWTVGGTPSSSGNAASPLFADPRIQSIYDTALNNFAGPERSRANERIGKLEEEKTGYQQELEQLLAQMNAEQRAKVLGALDDVRHNANVWADNQANSAKGSVNGAADSILGQIDSKIPGWVYNAWGIGDALRNAKDNLRGAINSARDWLNQKISWLQDRVKDAIWHFIESLKNNYRTGGEINALIEQAAADMKRKIDSLVGGINDWIGEFKGKITGSLSGLRNVGASGWNFYDGVVEPIANSVANNVRGAVSAVGSFANGAVDWLKPRAQSAVAAVVDAIFGDKTGQLYNKIHGVDQQIEATQSELERKIVQKASEFKNQLQGLLNTLGTDGKKLLDTILNFANSPGGQVTIEVIKIALGFVPLVGQAIDIVDTVIAVWKIAVEGRRDTDTWVELIGSLAGWFPGVGDAIKGIAKIAFKGPIGALLRKLGPDMTKQAAKIFKEANWKAILADIFEGLAEIWRKFDSQMDSAAGWILDLMPGVRPAIAAVGEIVVKFNDEAADAGKQLDNISKQIAKKIDDTSEQIAKEDQGNNSNDSTINGGGSNQNSSDDKDFDSTTKSVQKIIQRHVEDLKSLQKRLEEIPESIPGKNRFTKRIEQQIASAEKFKDDPEFPKSENSLSKIEGLKNNIGGFEKELDDALRPNINLLEIDTSKHGQQIDNVALDLEDGFTIFSEVKNAKVGGDYANQQATSVIEASAKNGLFTKARFVFLQGLDPQIKKEIEEIGLKNNVIVEIEVR